MNNVAILSTILMIITLLIVFGVTKGVSKKMNNRSVRWILYSYLIILVSSAVALYLIPQEGFLETGRDSSGRNSIYQRLSDGSYEDLTKEKLDEKEFIGKKGYWKFENIGETLRIIGASTGNVIVKRVDHLEDEIEVMSYTGSFYLGGSDVTHMGKEPEVTFQKGDLRIMPPESYRIEIYNFKKDFIYTQFIKDPLNSGREHGVFTPMEEIILIHVPRGLEIKGNQEGIKIIE
ncbi:hypothetical protein Amet_1848 [Alkaliphilus metalliredigens QYMF]|uniref:Uncharacterized protein n=1 Tax=Alkaliphilus metalliredigens (strain QYMF) TaxID=293826 RepID=A6TPA0_ALKMQ|nr:hypothetical protein [Alkaliphilus metalliredigens]ABR48018.1 hypothetical protein Amet_1848 [Alkaliphilus metalliredigens QYMF]